MREPTDQQVTPWSPGGQGAASFGAQGAVPVGVQSAASLARLPATAQLDDPLTLVAANLRESTTGIVVVVDKVPPPPIAPGTRMEADTMTPPSVVGVITEATLNQLAGAMVAEANGHALQAQLPSLTSWERFTHLRARDIMQTSPTIPGYGDLLLALQYLDHHQANALPVTDANGRFQGVISRASILASLGGEVRPPLVGGMATPVGVWLTTRTISAGAPWWALSLTGVLLATCGFVAFMVPLLLLSGYDAQIHSKWAEAYVSGRLGAEVGGGTFNLLSMLVQGLVFLLAMRSLPLTGYHAAEHQTVWAMEQGLALEPEVVRHMPRPHPRCGTNLAVLSMLITIVFQHLPAFDSGTVILALLAIYFTWRYFGIMVQQWFTTRPATLKQLESGIAAGRELIRRYQAPPARPRFADTFWAALALTATGMFVTMVFWTWVQNLLVNKLLS